MDKQKLLELADFIESNVKPRQFYMADWSIGTGENPVCETEALGDECGTACCIAGWAVLHNGFCLRGYSAFDKDGQYISSVEDLASNILNLQRNDVSGDVDLFFVGDWPDKFRQRFYDLDLYSPAKPQLAAEVIRDYVATDGWRE